MFPESIIDAIQELRRHYQGSKTYVTMNYPIIEIISTYNERETSLKLFYFPNKGTFEIQPMDAKYYQKISFYDYKKSERRWIRKKDLLFPIINNLKKCGLWELVSNKDFLIVNEHNERMDATVRDVNLQQILKPVDKK